jgi:type I restriction enzyme R subunit
VFGKYGAIFDYYDSLLIGLTATPREDVERSTYALLDLEEGTPNFTYELEQAIQDKNLVGYRAYLRSSKIMTEGLKYDDLSPADREQLERVWEYEKSRQSIDPRTDYRRDIMATEIYSYLFNIDTIDQVLQGLMENGLKVQDGNTLGKTIIFAYNHEHAVKIVERFHKLYPQLGEDYCVLIDNQVNYGQDLIDIFSTPRAEAQRHIQIVVSVDMMDTGIDVPDCLNLVFFKKVHSKIKFNQMIGRGTRLCPNVFGDGKDSKSS